MIPADLVPAHPLARERMLAGDPYLADDPELVAMHVRALERMEAYNAASLDRDRRRVLLGELLGSVGEDTGIRPPIYVDYGAD